MMKNNLVLIIGILLFAQCKPVNDVELTVVPTGSLDTLGIHWAVVEKPNIIYYFQDFNAQSYYALEYIDKHEVTYVTLSAVFTPKLPKKLRFFIWSDAALAEKLLGMPLGFTVSAQCVCHVRPTQSLGHEMTHALSYWSGGKPFTGGYSRFINEGLAVAFDLRTVNRIDEAKSYTAGENIQSVADVWSGSYQVSDDALYSLGGAFMDFMYKQNLPSQFNALIKDQSIQSAENIYGKNRLDSLIANFNSQMGW